MISKVLPTFLIEPNFDLIFFVICFLVAELAELFAGCYIAA